MSDGERVRVCGSDVLRTYVSRGLKEFFLFLYASFGNFLVQILISVCVRREEPLL